MFSLSNIILPCTQHWCQTRADPAASLSGKLAERKGAQAYLTHFGSAVQPRTVEGGDLSGKTLLFFSWSPTFQISKPPSYPLSLHRYFSWELAQRTIRKTKMWVPCSGCLLNSNTSSNIVPERGGLRVALHGECMGGWWGYAPGSYVAAVGARYMDNRLVLGLRSCLYPQDSNLVPRNITCHLSISIFRSVFVKTSILVYTL